MNRKKSLLTIAMTVAIATLVVTAVIYAATVIDETGIKTDTITANGSINLATTGQQDKTIKDIILGNLADTSLSGGVFSTPDIAWLKTGDYRLYALNGIRTDGELYVQSGDVLVENGRVAIGTTLGSAESWKLKVAGNMTLENSASGYRYSYIANSQSGLFTGVEMSGGGGLVPGSTAFAGVIGLQKAYPLQFYTNNAVRMTISSDGKIGIGTTAPAATLHVAGYPAPNPASIKIDGGGTNSTLTIVPRAVGNATAYLGLKESGTLLTSPDTGKESAPYHLWYNNGNGADGVNIVALDVWEGDSKLTLGDIHYTGGKVGIGITAPKTQLEVNGVIRTTPTTSATCNSDSEGGIYYNSGDKHFYGCNGTSWVQLDN